MSQIEVDEPIRSPRFCSAGGRKDQPTADGEEMQRVIPSAERVFRGGAFANPHPICGSGARMMGRADQRDTFVGFRVARTHR